jgi:hypothetical protein
MRGVILGWLMAAALVLSGCANSTSSRAIRTTTASGYQCEQYRGDPTTFARCQLFTSGLGADLIPAAGRSAGLEAQLRCAKFRRSLDRYETCIGIRSNSAAPETSVTRSAPGAVQVSRAGGDFRGTRTDANTGWMHGGYLSRSPSSTAAADTIAAPAAPTLSRGDAVRMLIQRSIASYRGSCPCPYNLDRAGRRCGGRSAYSRAGGYSPICYEGDVTEAMIGEAQ